MVCNNSALLNAMLELVSYCAYNIACFFQDLNKKNLFYVPVMNGE